VARRSAAWRAQRDPVVEENENAGQLDLLGGSALMVVRNATAPGAEGRDIVAPALRDLAARVRGLARAPGDRAVRQQAADGVLRAARRLRSDERVRDASMDSPLAGTVVSMCTAAADIMIFAGVDPDEATEALAREAADVDVPTPAPSPRTPFTMPWPSLKRPAD
jgi:hypothetical protein